jgi:trehalose/maltose hydrolase-like predicted phosphorylase
MYPGLLVLSPEFALSIDNYRLKNLGAAMQNAKQYNLTGALYPWTGYPLFLKPLLISALDSVTVQV